MDQREIDQDKERLAQLEEKHQQLLKKLRAIACTLPKNTELSSINDFGVFKLVYGDRQCPKIDLEHIFLFSATNGIVRNVEYLLPLIGSTNSVIMNISFGEAAKHNHLHVLKLFDKTVVDVDYDDGYAMNHAISGGYTGVVQHLVENGAKVTVDLAILCCEQGDYRDILEILVKKCPEPLSTYYQQMIVLCLDKPERSQITEFLVTYVDPEPELNEKIEEFLYGSYQDALFEREVEYTDFENESADTDE